MGIPTRNGPTVKVPANQDDWLAWSTVEKQRDELLAQIESGMKDHERRQLVLAYAQSTQGWHAKDWKITKPLAADAPTEPKQWTVAKGIPGSISGRQARGKLPSQEQAVWLSANVKVPQQQSLWLVFSGAEGSEVYLKENSTPLTTKSNSERTAHEIVSLPEGQHELHASEVRVIGWADPETYPLQKKRHSFENCVNGRTCAHERTPSAR